MFRYCSHRELVLLRRKADTNSYIWGPKRDPISVLPADVLRLIFLHCTMRECVRASCVSKMWRKAINSVSLLWEVMKFEDSGRPPDIKAQWAYFKRSRGSLRTLCCNGPIGQFIKRGALGHQLTTLKCSWPTNAIPDLCAMKQLQVLEISCPDFSKSKQEPIFAEFAHVVSVLPNLLVASASIKPGGPLLPQYFADLKSASLQSLTLTSRADECCICAAALLSAHLLEPLMPQLQSLCLNVDCILRKGDPTANWPKSLIKLDVGRAIRRSNSRMA